MVAIQKKGRMIPLSLLYIVFFLLEAYSHKLGNVKDWRLHMKTARNNLNIETSFNELGKESVTLDPGNLATPFMLYTLGSKIEYPNSIFKGSSILFHSFDNRSAFLECMWTSNSSLNSLITGFPDNAHYVFIPTGRNPTLDAQWMQNQIQIILRGYNLHSKSSILSNLHFVSTSLDQLGNWIPAVFRDWACTGHGCGFSQVSFSLAGNTMQPPLILKRLDAHYDWLPSPDSTFKNQSIAVVHAGSGCYLNTSVFKKLALIQEGVCSFSKKVTMMEKSGAIGVLVYALPGHPVEDMNCEDDECSSPPSIPASMIPWSQDLLYRVKSGTVNAVYQTTPSNNYYFAIDSQGVLAEFGWSLYPSFQFFNWQAQWFNYKTELLSNLSRSALVLPVINSSIMQGDIGIVSTVKLPTMKELEKYDRFELDASLSCPGLHDDECPPWDHTVQLYVCCDSQSPLCGMELGRWITPFRRRIGRWLTDVTSLLPLLSSTECNFTMKTVPWAKAWKPSLNLRFSVRAETKSEGSVRPSKIIPLFRGGTFNQSYNQKYVPIKFTIPSDVKRVMIAAIITGHGSDENGCGEFCVTSHHFVVNGNRTNVKTFSNAGTPLGCAERVRTGVEPNEHGTWLYGRDGWCDGREVDPWVFDISDQVSQKQTNSILYFGWFNGADPNPHLQPGEIKMYSYLIFYNETL